MAGNLARKTGKKNRKHGRNLSKCAAYSKSNRREKNKARRLRKHIAKHPNDGIARGTLSNL